ncbi:hypothetical protein LMH87_011433 [Akanthomyces muscarius]|uniref:Glycosyl transferase n=1 Tax=Akanthomyces muscarius TaxID=2231603 RepID=A0A9W8UKZ3_AKAMU|nr:hypothetical protein LMH87_011433 [Akanthomyces muscarius]KAJ4150696.1 hypothetical protein LMH87_011433 [Akanthomyces muscarius]
MKHRVLLLLSAKFHGSRHKAVEAPPCWSQLVTTTTVDDLVALSAANTAWHTRVVPKHPCPLGGSRMVALWRFLQFISLFYGWFQALPRETRVLMLSESVTASCKPNETLYTDEASCATRHDRAPIPNIAHFVYILSDPDNGTFPFKFSHFLSVYGAWRRWQPDVLYLHTNVAASSSAVLQARAGEQGKWAQRLFNMPGLVINTISAPTHTNRGQELKHMEHRSDFVRVKVVHDFGGVYMDMDVHALRDMRPLREAGYKAVAGRQGGGLLNSGTFLAAKGSKATRMWMERMHEVYDGGWTTHSNEALTTLGEDMKMYPCEMLMLDQAAFAPIGWKWRRACGRPARWQ